MITIKRFLIFTLSLLFFSYFSGKIVAQNELGISTALEQLDSTSRENFAEDLDILNNELDFSDFDFDGVNDSLMQAMNLELNIDSLLDAWGAGRDTLFNLLDIENTGIEGAESILSQYDFLNSIWTNKLDSFGLLLDFYQDSITMNDFEEGDDRFDGASQGNWGQGQDLLNELFKEGTDNTEAQGLNDFDEIVRSLFSSMFDLELAFGAEWSDIEYYTDKNAAQAFAFRVGSVPSYQATFETRWHVNASFSRTLSNPLAGEGEIVTEEIRPLLWGGEFSLLFNPTLGFLQDTKTGFRLYSSLGMEIQTNVPEYIRSDRPSSQGNVGKTTGFGPQVGAGFIINTPSFNMYTYGTFATGNVAESGYRYNSKTVNAGVRYGDVANFLYTLGESDWANGDNKNAIYHRFTIGLLINHLFE